MPLIRGLVESANREKTINLVGAYGFLIHLM